MVTIRDIDDSIRANLIRLLQEAGISQEYLASWSGVSHIAQIESGNRPAGKDVVVKLANALNVNFSEFYKINNGENPGESTLLTLFRKCSDDGQSAILEMAKIFLEYERKTKFFGLNLRRD